MTNIINGTYAVFYRELVLLKSRMFHMGHVLYILFSPIIFLTAFGLGLGSRIDTGTTEYSTFLLQGIACMSSMTNAYSLVTSSVSMGRLNSGSFQTVITAPVGRVAVVAGLILSGIVRGFLAVLIVIIAGILLFGVFPFGWQSVFALVLNMWFFSSLGIVFGLKMQSIETNAFIANFVIMPMAFFSGTFYPVDYLPAVMQKIVYLLPLCHTNILMRADGLTPDALRSAAVLLVMCFTGVITGTKMLSGYTE